MLPSSSMRPCGQGERPWSRSLKTFSLVLAALVLGFMASARAEAPRVVALEAIGAGFRATLSDGAVKQGAELAGAVLVFAVGGTRLRIRIAAITPDPTDPTGTVLLHDFRYDDTGAALCAPDPSGRQLGFPLAGRSAGDGRLLAAESGAFELICTSGAQGKCVRFGYHPWTQAPDGRPMRDSYNACVRMVRADYCGTGTATTRDGMLIDVYDDSGIQKPDHGPGTEFEAGWTAGGAVCVRRVRVKENISLDSLVAACPRLKDRVGAMCTEDKARAFGARLFNLSRP